MAGPFQAIRIIDRLSGLSDCAVTTPSDGHVMVYNGSAAKWENAAAVIGPIQLATATTASMNTQADRLGGGYASSDEPGLVRWMDGSLAGGYTLRPDRLTFSDDPGADTPKILHGSTVVVLDARTATVDNYRLNPPAFAGAYLLVLAIVASGQAAEVFFGKTNADGTDGAAVFVNASGVRTTDASILADGSGGALNARGSLWSGPDPSDPTKFLWWVHSLQGFA